MIRGILGDVTHAFVPRRPLRGLVVAAVAGLLVVAAASGAQAHDVLQSTDPADGSTVATAPDHVTLTFEEPAQALGTEIQVLGPQGEALSVGPPVVTGSAVTQEVAPVRPAGTYTVNWRVTSQDGHPVSGTFTFTATDPVGLPAGVTPTPVAPDTSTPTAAPTTTGVDPAAWGHGDNKVHPPLVGLLLLLVAGGVALATWLVTRRTGS